MFRILPEWILDAAGIVLVLAGTQYWPLGICGIFLLTAVRPMFGVLAALMLDALYGAPHQFPFVPIPLTLFFICFMVIYQLGKKFTSAGERQIRVGR